MKTNSVPAVVMLLAGLIDCVVSIYQRLSLLDFTKRLLLVLVIFYVLGCIVKIILDMNFKQMEDVPPEAGEASEPEADAEAKLKESAQPEEGASAEELENIDAQEDGE